MKYNECHNYIKKALIDKGQSSITKNKGKKISMIDTPEKDEKDHEPVEKKE